jgi:NAD(P)-dependent dehydrogenase (short-subunit alcohol dehydrogenase family)
MPTASCPRRSQWTSPSLRGAGAEHHERRSEHPPRSGHHRRALADELGNGAIEADLTDRDSIIAAAERVHQELGPADILVNNAGVMLLAPFEILVRPTAQAL